MTPDDIFDYFEPARVLSPCVDICEIDGATGWCVGCGRTGDEIGEWPDSGDMRRQAIVDALPPRIAALRTR